MIDNVVITTASELANYYVSVGLMIFFIAAGFATIIYSAREHKKIDDWNEKTTPRNEYYILSMLLLAASILLGTYGGILISTKNDPILMNLLNWAIFVILAAVNFYIIKKLRAYHLTVTRKKVN